MCNPVCYYSVIVIQVSDWITQNLLELSWINENFYFESEINGITLRALALGYFFAIFVEEWRKRSKVEIETISLFNKRVERL